MFLRFFVMLSLMGGCNPQVNTKLLPPAKEQFAEKYTQASNIQSIEGNTSLLGQEQVADVKKSLESQDHRVSLADNKEFDLSCQTDEDCVFISLQTKETPCCAFDNKKSNFIAVNREKASKEKCDKDCTNSPSFGPQAQSSCVNNLCEKIMPPPESTSETP